jgi:hypothetical protein
VETCVTHTHHNFTNTNTNTNTQSHLTRTLSEMEDNAPHIATDVEGRQITIPTGNFIGGQFTGPAPFTRTADGGLAVLGTKIKVTELIVYQTLTAELTFEVSIFNF